jgi:hypothetical protein
MCIMPDAPYTYSLAMLANLVLIFNMWNIRFLANQFKASISHYTVSTPT